MVALLKRVAIFYTYFIVYSLLIVSLVTMYKDLRIRNANKPTAVPRDYKAYVFRAPALDTFVYKIILAPSFIIAYQRLKDFSNEQGFDLFWSLVCEDDFEVVHKFDIVPHLF